VIFEWNSLDHVPLTESMSKPANAPGPSARPYDYFHINSIDVAWDGDLLVSSRDASAVYKVGRRDGQANGASAGRIPASPWTRREVLPPAPRPLGWQPA